MASPDLPATGSRIRLRGYERFMAIADHSNSKIAHIMMLRASAPAREAFLAQLPRAVVQTFNHHPRMRATQVRDAFALAEIQPAVTLESVATRALLEVQTFDYERDAERWEVIAERECAALLDRYTQFPYYVRAWHYRNDGFVRLMVVSDHYMSDGISGLIVLNDIVTFAAALTVEAAKPSGSTGDPSELPLRPSLYDMWLAPHTWWLRLSRWGVALFGKSVYVSQTQRFTPVLVPRSDQADFAVPICVNSSSAMFGQGSPENMRKTLRRCKDERVTFFGALAACVVLAYAIASGHHASDQQDASNDNSGTHQKSEKKTKKKPFKLAADMDFNMRKRIASPVPEDPIGAYMAISALESLTTKGVDMDTVAFWDLARACKQELDATLTGSIMPLQLLFVDANIHSELTPEFARDVRMPQSIGMDVNISNVGRYPYALTHVVTPAASAGTNDSSDVASEELRIENLYLYNSNPHIGPGAIVYVTATNQLNYSMMHKYDSEVARSLFDAYVTSLEHIGEIASGETMTRVADKVVEAIKASGGAVSSGATQSSTAQLA